MTFVACPVPPYEPMLDIAALGFGIGVSLGISRFVASRCEWQAGPRRILAVALLLFLGALYVPPMRSQHGTISHRVFTTESEAPREVAKRWGAAGSVSWRPISFDEYRFSEESQHYNADYDERTGILSIPIYRRWTVWWLLGAEQLMVLLLAAGLIYLWRLGERRQLALEL